MIISELWIFIHTQWYSIMSTLYGTHYSVDYLKLKQSMWVELLCSPDEENGNVGILKNWGESEIGNSVWGLPEATRYQAIVLFHPHVDLCLSSRERTHYFWSRRGRTNSLVENWDIVKCQRNSLKAGRGGVMSGWWRKGGIISWRVNNVKGRQSDRHLSDRRWLCCDSCGLPECQHRKPTARGEVCRRNSCQRPQVLRLQLGLVETS